MKVFKIELMVVDFDDLGAEGIKEVLENTDYPNHCLDPRVKSCESRDIDMGSCDEDSLLIVDVDEFSDKYDRLFAAPSK